MTNRPPGFRTRDVSAKTFWRPREVEVADPFDAVFAKRAVLDVLEHFERKNNVEMIVRQLERKTQVVTILGQRSSQRVASERADD